MGWKRGGVCDHGGEWLQWDALSTCASSHFLARGTKTRAHTRVDRPSRAPPLLARCARVETVQHMFMTPLYQQHTSRTLASRVYGPQPHMRS